MEKFLKTKYDLYYIMDNETWEQKDIWREKDFIEYVKFYTKSPSKIKNIWNALDYFTNNMGWWEVWVGLEVCIRCEF